MRLNQYTAGVVRRKRLPSIAVSKAERMAAEEFAQENHMTLAQLVRCGLVLMGSLDTASLNDVDPAIAEQVASGKGLGPIKRAQP